MTALELISLASQALFIGLFVAVLLRALTRPSRAAWDTVLLFGSVAAVVALVLAADWLRLGDQPWLTGLVLLLLSVAPYAMIRLVDDFSRTPPWLLPFGAVAFAAVGVLGFVAFATAPQLYELVTITWFLGVGGYAAYAFARAAVNSRGITRRRMTAVALGAVLFIGAIVAAFVDALATGVDLEAVTQLGAFFAVIAFFLGFAPPDWIRRAWREPDLRRFLERSLQLSALRDERRAVIEIQHAAAAAFGAAGASIGLAVEGHPVLRYVDASGEWIEYPDDAFIAGRAFREQRRVVAMDAAGADPEHASVYRRNAATTVIAAPVTSDDRRIGVLSVFAERAPIFVEDDLWLLELLADHIAVLLESRKLAAVESTLRAREESARLKEEFLSAAAHDLRTPLTVVLGQAELLERRVARDPNAPVDAAGVTRLAREARRLRDLVSELLDAQRLEQGAAVMDPVTTDLRDIVEEVRLRFHDLGIDFKANVPDTPVTATVDVPRFEQVVDNLIENALKYGAAGPLPEVKLERDNGAARLTVVDHGLGVPEDERERIFDRFYRATNVQALPDTGIGLGLYICRRIVESHGGRIWVEPTPGGGSTFVVSVPAQSAPAHEMQPETPASVPAAPGAEAIADA
jgi:signal transduction histidine kinase